jgi:hypothetical protein
VGCKNQALSENYAKQLYTRRYLRGGGVFSDLVFANGQNNVVFVFAIAF